MKAVVWQGEDLVTVEDVANPASRHSFAIIDIAFAGICGTDLHICANHHPRAKPGLILGHEMVGWIAERGKVLPKGTAVFINPLISCGSCPPCIKGLIHVCEELGLYGIDQPGGLAEQVSVPESALIEIPNSLDMKTAALIEPLAVNIRALHRSGMKAGDRVHILGAGPIGLLMAMVAKYFGAGAITMSEPNVARVQRAANLGFEIYSGKPDRRADVLFDCTGHPLVSETITQWTATGGKIMVVGVYPGVVGFDLRDINFREIDVFSTRVYTIADIKESISVLTEGAIAGVTAIISSVVPLTAGPEAIAQLKTGHEMKVLVQGREG